MGTTTRVSCSRYGHLVTDPAWRAEQERKEAEKLERFVGRVLEWDGVSEELPASMETSV